MLSLLESAAEKFGVPAAVLDLIGKNFLSQVIDEFPDLLLPPIMSTLKQAYAKNGLEGIRQNAMTLQKQFLVLRQMYGPTWILA
jgi:hypothetical protein